jgi:DNA polymerase III epsilon subunit-like protein
MLATVFDTETTGLIVNPARKLDTQPEIISIAIQKIDMKELRIGTFYYKTFKPIKSIPSEITKITGFTDESVENCPSINEYLDEIIGTLEDSQLLIGQNIRFDMSMIELECRRYKRTIKWPRVMDLIENTIHLKGYRLSLTNLHIELFGKPFEGAHQADTDVLITCKCAIELFKRGLL